MKRTMSLRNIAKMNSFLSKGMPLKEVSQHLKVDVATIKRFMTPEQAPDEATPKAAPDEHALKAAPKASTK